jgi:CO/xanthine dehydrogenase Mo-binding subunit
VIRLSELVRKQVYITQSQENLLKRKAAEMGVTEAELIREALDSQMYTIGYPRRSAQKWQEEGQFIEERMAGKEHSAQRTWKREELYDR